MPHGLLEQFGAGKTEPHSKPYNLTLGGKLLFPVHRDHLPTVGTVCLRKCRNGQWRKRFLCAIVQVAHCAICAKEHLCNCESGPIQTMDLHNCVNTCTRTALHSSATRGEWKRSVTHITPLVVIFCGIHTRQKINVPVCELRHTDTIWAIVERNNFKINQTLLCTSLFFELEDYCPETMVFSLVPAVLDPLPLPMIIAGVLRGPWSKNCKGTEKMGFSSNGLQKLSLRQTFYCPWKKNNFSLEKSVERCLSPGLLSKNVVQCIIACKWMNLLV